MTASIYPRDGKNLSSLSPSSQDSTPTTASKTEQQAQEDMKFSSDSRGYNNDWRRSSKDKPIARKAAFPIEKLPGSLPSANIHSDVDHERIASSFLKRLDHFNPEIFTEDAMWRDVYALTGTLRTFNGREEIKTVWTKLSELHHQTCFLLIPESSKIVRLQEGCSWIQARFTFQTSGKPETLCSGHIGIVPHPTFGWKAWLLSTVLEEIKGHPNPDYFGPGVTERAKASARESCVSTRFDCVVAGAGFAGLCLSARLRAMEIRYVALESNAQIGDSWRKRYDSARFHTTRDYGETPLERSFTEDDDIFLSGQDLGRGYQKYAEKHQLNIWLSTTLKSASFDENDRIWTLKINRKGQETTITSPHFVFALGAGGAVPKMPQLPNMDLFKGTVIHSADYKSARQWEGQVGVVVGTANTAHDVAEDMVAAKLASTTMIQRSPTTVIPVEYFQKWSDTIYNRDFPVEDADRESMSFPIAITRQATIMFHNALAAVDHEKFDSLERAGFRVERFLDLWKLLTERLGGHYLDIGTSAKISRGLIKVKGDAALTGFTETGLEFSDGSTLDADVVVFCTGFEQNLRDEAIKIVGPEIGDKLEDYWQLDDEGELRGAFKPMGHPGIWYIGGGTAYSRFYSRFIALSIKADCLGVPLSVYAEKPAGSAH